MMPNQEQNGSGDAKRVIRFERSQRYVGASSVTLGTFTSFLCGVAVFKINRKGKPDNGPSNDAPPDEPHIVG